MGKIKKVKQILSIILIWSIFITGMNITTVKASTLGSGKLNKDGTITWSLSSEGILTISGSGVPNVYTSSAEVPWDTLRERIKKVQINTDTSGIQSMAYWFKGCTNLVYINRLPENLEDMGSAFSGCTAIEEVPMIPMYVQQMASAFSGCTSLKKIPEFEILGVSNFAYCFKDCKSLEYAYLSLSYPVISAKGIFSGCENLDATVVFNGCIQLKAENCTDMFTGAGVAEGRSINVFAVDMTIDKVKQMISAAYDKVNYCGVIDTKNGRNYNYDAAQQCSYAYVDSTNTLYVSGRGNVNLSGLMYNFSNLQKVKNLNIGYGIAGINAGAFENYSILETVMIPSTIQSISKSEFKGCTSLKNLALSSGITQIGEEAFSGCQSMETLYIPDSVHDIGNGAFRNMSGQFYLECSAKNEFVQGYAKENGIPCKYPKTLEVSYKGNVTEGCKLDSSNFENIELLYSDKSRIQIPFEQITIEEYEIVTGENILTAHYGDFTCTFEVTGIEKNVIGIEVIYDEEYDFTPVEGGKIDTDAISVLAEYDNGTKQYLEYGGITDETDTISMVGYYTIDPYNLLISSDGSLNEVVVRVKVSDSSVITKVGRIYVPAEKKRITGITAVYVGGKIVEGTGVNTENIYVYANFNNGTKERVLFSGNYNTYGMDINTNYRILDETIEYEDVFAVSQEYEYSIDAYHIKNGNNMINLWCDSKQTSIEVSGMKKSQTGISAVYDGNAIEDGILDMTRLTVFLDYNNGDKERLTDMDSVTLAEEYCLMQGDNYVEVSYVDVFTGKKYKCNVYVKGVEKTPVEITNVVPVRTDLIAGELLKNIEFNVSVQYDNGKVYDSITSWDLNGCVLEGENHITISYKGLSKDVVFQADAFIPQIVTSIGTKPPAVLEKNSSVMLAVKANSQAALEEKEIGWSSSDKTVVHVSDTGMVTALDYGTAKITATVNGKNAVYDVEVPMPDVTGIRAEYEGKVLEDTGIDMDKLTVYLQLENHDEIKLEDKSSVTLQKNYEIKGGRNEIEVFYVDYDTAQKYTCQLIIDGIEKTPIEIVEAEAVRDNIIAGEVLRTLEFKVKILCNNEKVYEEIIKYESKGFAQKGLNQILLSYKGIWGQAEFVAGEFVPQIVLENGENVPKEVKLDTILRLKVTSNCEAALENKPILWRSSDENVMTVDENGVVQILKPGTSDITVKVNDESVKCTIRVIVPATNLKFDADNITISAGTSKCLKYKIQPDNSTDNIRWVSSNTDIAVVSETGEVTAVNIGTCVINAGTESGLTRQIHVTVKKEAEKITLNYQKAYIIKGKTLQLKYAIPDSTYTSKVTWISNDKNVATVSSTGKVTAKKIGTAVVSVKTAAGKKCTCRLYVRTNPGNIALNKKNVTLKKGKSVKLKYAIPVNSYASKITWFSKNKKIAVVSSTGKVTAKKKGITYIMVKTNNNKSAKCRIKVV